MKTTSIIAVFLCMTTASFAQTINWESLKPEQKHIGNVNFGYDYSTTIGLGYGYRVKMKIPVLLEAQVSIPAGEDLNDFKTKLGGQVRAYKAGNFLATVKVYAIFRQFKSDLVGLQSFGSEFTGVFGYYKPKWFAAAEFGFDKAIATNVENSEIMKQYYPNVQDGWYVPTGGNFYFGIQGGYTIKTFDVAVKAGKIVDQSFHTTALVPFYFQLGVNKRF